MSALEVHVCQCAHCQQEAEHPLVAMAMEATRCIGRDGELTTASTDANVPISRGIPAIAIGDRFMTSRLVRHYDTERHVGGDDLPGRRRSRHCVGEPADLA